VFLGYKPNNPFQNSGVYAGLDPELFAWGPAGLQQENIDYGQSFLGRSRILAIGPDRLVMPAKRRH
jgi:hypothetical protein